MCIVEILAKLLDPFPLILNLRFHIQGQRRVARNRGFPSRGVEISLKDVILRVLSKLGRRKVLDKLHFLDSKYSQEKICLCP